MKYRKEIDGLRAIAVIPVILFHAGFEHFSGGFVGVDVFFVISGYLITTIILSEKDKGIFSLVNFYERRSRRILPSLFLVMLVSTIFAWFWLPPSHMKDFSESLVAVSIFSSNILFWKETGYWGVESELKPLLHTWSLAVEEQYYALFPLFLILIWRFGKRWVLGSLFIIALGSLALSHWAAFNKPSANFFLLATRGWELVIGAGIAFYFLYQKPAIRSLWPQKSVDELLSWSGLLLILYSIFIFDENTPFPSLYALVPTIGTALIIVFSTKETFSGKFLGSRALVGVGLISYSAYLWHQPLFVFARHRSLHDPSPLLFTALSVLSLVLAFVSWKYIEAPFRNRGNFSRNQIFSFTLIGSLFFIAFGMAGHYSEGYEFRVDAKLSKIIQRAKQKSFSDKLCEKIGENPSQEDKPCVLVSNQEKLVFLYGDSHAQALMFEAKRAFAKTNYGLLFAATSACPPVQGVYRADNPNKKACYEQNNKIYEDIVNNPLIEYVILSARWTLGMEGVRFNNMEGGVEHGPKPQLDIVENGKYLLHEDYSHRELIAKAYIDSIQYFLDSGKKVILIYPVPEAGWNVPDYISRFNWIKSDTTFKEQIASTSYQVFKERNNRTIDALDEIGQNENLQRIFPEKILCDSILSERCITNLDGLILYRDDDHLSDAGAKLVLQKIIDRVR
ncbi:MAG: acyltransferase [Gammaproteobacteria bacterium]|nr:acyltransferase [Gammaproteobacteria bacterium]